MNTFLSNIKILLVEDNPVDSELFQDFLDVQEIAEFSVTVENTMSDAIYRLSDGGIDIVLLDLTLPDSSGIETYENLKIQSPDIPVIILTGLQDKQLAIKAMQKGAQDYLVKDEVNPNTLSRAIVYAIERSRTRKEIQVREENFRQIISRNVNGCIITNEDGIIKFVNPAAEQLFDSFSFNMVGKTFQYPIKLGREVSIEIMTSKGKKFAEMSTVETEWEGKFALLISLSDVTRQKKAETQKQFSIEILESPNDKKNIMSTLERVMEKVKDFLPIDGLGMNFVNEDGQSQILGNGISLNYANTNSIVSELKKNIDTFKYPESGSAAICTYGCTERGSIWLHDLNSCNNGTFTETVKEIIENKSEIESFNSMAIIPLENENENQGYLYALFKDVSVTPDTLHFLEDLSTSIRTAVTRIRYEEKIYNQLQFLHAFIDSIPNPIYYKDDRGIYQGCNKDFEDFLGLSKDEIIGKSIDEIASDEEAQTHKMLDHELMEEGGRRTYEAKISGEKGKERDVVFYKEAFTRKNKKIGGIVGVITDLTQQIKTQKRVVHLNRVYKASRNISRLVAGEKDKQSLLRHTCEILTRTRGYSSAWIVLFSGNKPVIATESGLGQRFSMAVKEMRNPEFFSYINNLFKSKNAVSLDDNFEQLDEENLNSFKQLFETGKGMLGKLNYNGRGFGLIGVSIPDYLETDAEEFNLFDEISMDIAYALKNIDAEAKLSILSTAIDQSADSVMITGPDGEIQYVNAAFRKITGYDFKEVLHKKPSILKSGKHKDEFYKKLWEKITDGKVWKGTFVNKRKDGTLFNEEATIFPMIGDHGEIKHFTKISRDVTKKMKLEDQLQQSQKMEAIGRLAGGIAHDFNNLLTGILGNVEMMDMKLPKQHPAKDYISEVKYISKRASELTKQLLAFGRRQVTNPEVININEGVRNLEKMVRRLISENIDLEVDLKDDVSPILIDRSHLDQIILNLVINARDAMPEGGRLKIETISSKPGKSTLMLNPSIDFMEYSILKISDNGIGMDEKTMNHIFEPFFTTKGREKGTGLGLSTVYGIVKQAGGHIHVESRAGEGTTFKIYFPRVLEKVEQKEKKIRKKTSRLLGGSEQVLIVEDEDIIRKLIKKTLDKVGYDIAIASKGEDALRIYSGMSSKPVLLLTDVILPDMNGIELASMMQKSNPDMKVIFMSGYAEDVISRYGAIHDQCNFLEKPFGMSNLLSKIRQVLDT